MTVTKAANRQIFLRTAELLLASTVVNYKAETLIDPAVRGWRDGLQRHGSFEYILSNPAVKKK